MATDFNQQKVEKDPVLLPSLAKDEVLKQWPITAILTGDFDAYRDGASMLAERLETAGRLCEFVSYTGSISCHFENPEYLMSEKWYEDFEALIEKYVTEK